MCTSAVCIEILTKSLPHLQEQYGVTSLSLFGSMARGNNREDSDVDILVDMPPKIFLISSLQEYLTGILHTSVDVVRRHSHLSPRFLKQVERDEIKLL